MPDGISMTDDDRGSVPVVLTVCLGNICRSPTAEATIRAAAVDADVPVVVRSAGTGSWNLGDPPDARMRTAAAAVGIELGGTAELVTAEAMAAADLVVAMDRSNLADLERIAREAQIDTPVRMFRAFDPASLDAGDLDVPDPYYGGEDGFAHVVSLCRDAAEGVVAFLTGDREDPGPR